MHGFRHAALAVATSLLFSACSDDPTDTLSSTDPAFSAARAPASHAIRKHQVRDVAPFFAAQIAETNERLAAHGANLRLDRIDLLLAADAPADMGTTVFANDRTHHLPYFWVRNDPRREADGSTLTYLVDEDRSFAFTRAGFAYLGNQFDSSFAPWSGLPCGSLDLVKEPDTGAEPITFDPDGNVTWLADIIVAGWHALPPGVLGTTSTFVFVDDAGNPTDIDGDGRYDTALALIAYSLAYYWIGNDPAATNAVDLQSVAIHENGHALGIGHFGKIFVTNANGMLHFSPRAVMNAAYVFPLQELQGTDAASYCGNFATWQ